MPGSRHCTATIPASRRRPGTTSRASMATASRLRPLREDDAARIVEGCADPRTQEWLEFLPSPYTLEDAHEFLQSRRASAAGGRGSLVGGCGPRTDGFLASVGIPRIDHGSCEIGYWAHPDARGRGVVSEGVRMLLRHVFLDVEDGGLGIRGGLLEGSRRQLGFAAGGRRQRLHRVRARARGDAASATDRPRTWWCSTCWQANGRPAKHDQANEDAGRTGADRWRGAPCARRAAMMLPHTPSC